MGRADDEAVQSEPETPAGRPGVRITAPNPSYSGWVGAVWFHDGVAELDPEEHPAVVAYAVDKGYTVEHVDNADTEQPPPPDDPSRGERAQLRRLVAARGR